MSAKQKKRRLSSRFAVFITILLFVCTILFLNSRVSSGSLRRVAYWIFNGVSGDATEASINFDAGQYNRFVINRGSLCVLAPEELSVYKVSGKKALSVPVLLRSPAISSNNSCFIAYDLGGLNFYVANNRKLLYSGTTEAVITNANMSKSGAFTVITSGPDCKSLVTVYNTSFKPVYRFHSSEKFVFDAAVTPNCRTVAMLTYGTVEGKFESTLALCKTNSDRFYNTVSLGDSMPVKIEFLSDSRILVVCDDRTLIVDINGSIISEFSYDGLSLKSFSRGNHISLLLDNYKNGGNSKLILIKSNGEMLGNIDCSEDIYSVSSAGNYTAVQFSDRCIVYNNTLDVHCEFKIPSSITRCFVNSDGSVISIGDNFATLYVS